MRKVTNTLYNYDELSDEAKTKARDWWRTYELDYEWWDSVFDDAKTIGALMGIEIENIYFSGFSCLGAKFTGTYTYRKGSVQAVKEYAPQDETLHRIAKELQEIQKRHFYGLTANVESSGRYSHEYCTEIEVIDGDNLYAGKEAEEALSNALRDYMRWIYRRLQEEYWYLQEDEQVEENILANEYEFTEDGEIS